MKTIYPRLPIYGDLNEIKTACMEGWQEGYYEQLRHNPYEEMEQASLHNAYNHGFKVGEQDLQNEGKA